MKTKTQKSLIKLGEKLAKNPNMIAKPGKLNKPRNHLALNPLMRKGGLHGKDDVAMARKRQRRQSQQELRRVDWLR